MHDIHLALRKLNAYCDAKRKTVEQLKSLAKTSKAAAIDYHELINELTEVCTECRQTRESTVFDNTHDSWEFFVKIISVEHLLAFFTGLIDLATKEASAKDLLHRKVSMTACRAYILLLTSPGAKIFDAFEPDLLRKVFKMFEMVKKLDGVREHERIQIQMLMIMLLEDFQLYLKHVSFEEYEDLQVQFIESIAAIMEFHHEKGFQNKYSFQMQELCYGILENVCLPIHGSEITSSLSMVLNGTSLLTRFHRPCAGSMSMKPKYPLITDWFIEMLHHYPRQTCDVLNRYIQTILTDTDLVGNRETLARYLDICAQYDAAMVRICGESSVDFLEQLALSKESQHRVNCVEMIGRMLVKNTQCNWKIFRSELPKTPREIKLLRILMQKTYDANNVVALKGINAFLKVANDGNDLSKEILTKIFTAQPTPETPAQQTPTREPAPNTQGLSDFDENSADEEENIAGDGNKSDAENDTSAINREQTDGEATGFDYTKTKEYRELLTEFHQNLLCAIKIQLKNTSALVRRATVLLLEFAATTNLDIDQLLLSYDFRQLYIDQSPLVRRQLVLSLDQILNARPTNEAAITAWIKIVLDLANDTDAKVMETVIESFKRNIFDNIQNYEKSSSPPHVFPWRLLKNMLNCKDCPDFRISVQKWMNKNLLSAKTLSKIETHLDTNNATEAWILLAMVAPNIQGKSQNPERVSKLLLQNLKYDMTNTVENCYIQLEVLSFWLKYLNSPSKNEIKRLMTEMLTTGSLRPRNINRAFGICYTLSTKSGESDRQQYVDEIRNACESYILTNRNSMFVPNLCDDRLISYLYLYSEIGSIPDMVLHVEIVDFFFVFLRTAAEGQLLTVQNDSMLSEKVSCILSVLTGLSSFNHEICSRFVPLLGRTLRTIELSEVSFTAIKCLGYLCKKNTAVVEAVVPYILMKTQHHYANIREFALKTLATLILEDFLKFRGTLLIYVLAGMLDTQREIKELAAELIMKYTLEKNEIFMRTCLLECPFVFNGSPCFGQTMSSVSRSGNILKGVAKQPAREYIYRYLIRKVDAVHLYMYFGNVTRLLDHIEKENLLSQSVDMQTSVADFLYICTEICIANEKQKKNLTKITKENQNGDDMLEDNEMLSAPKDTAAAADNEADGTTKGRRGKKNQPTITQALAVVEKIVPMIATIDEKLRPLNPTLYAPVIDRLCTEMCIHFEALLEYGQPRKFWAKYLQMAKKSSSIPVNTSRQVSKASTSKAAEVSTTPTRSRAIRSRNEEENDSGQFTIEDGSHNRDDESVSKKSMASKRSKPAPKSVKKARDARYKSSSSGQGHDSDSSSSSESTYDDGQSSCSSISINRRKKSQHSTPSTSNKMRKSLPPQTPPSRKSTRHR